MFWKFTLLTLFSQISTVNKFNQKDLVEETSSDWCELEVIKVDKEEFC